MPAYNAEKYISEAIESVINQDFSDFELIIVDDGSSDSTGLICEEFSKSDRRIKLLRKINGGVASARNAGLDAAKGSYIFFIDADDIIPRNSISVLFEGLSCKNDIDISAGTFIKFKNRKRSGLKNRCDYDWNFMTGEMAAKMSLYQKGINNSLCGKLFDISLWRDIRFTEGELYEDLDIFYILCARSRGVALTKEIVYYYRLNPLSITHVFSPSRLDVLKVTKRIRENIYNVFPSLEGAARERELSAHFNMLGLMLNERKIYKHQTASFYEDKIDECRNFLKKNIPIIKDDPHLRLKSRIGIRLYEILPQSMFEKILQFVYR